MLLEKYRNIKPLSKDYNDKEQRSKMKVNGEDLSNIEKMQTRQNIISL